MIYWTVEKYNISWIGINSFLHVFGFSDPTNNIALWRDVIGISDGVTRWKKGEAAGRVKAGLARNRLQYGVMYNFKTGFQCGHIFISYKIQKPLSHYYISQLQWTNTQHPLSS